MERSSDVFPRTVKDIFDDFESRRRSLVRALTVDMENFYRQCEKVIDNLCLLAHTNGNWEITVPDDNLPQLAEPLLSLQFSKEGLKKDEWLYYVAVSSDSWLLSLAFYYGALAGFDERDRNELFQQINSRQTVLEAYKDARIPMNESSGGNSSSKNKTDGSKMSASKRKAAAKDDDKGICGVCHKTGNSMDRFWILCDYCKKWFHGKCVSMDAPRAKHIEFYKCPRCNKRGRKA